MKAYELIVTLEAENAMLREAVNVVRSMAPRNAIYHCDRDAMVALIELAGGEYYGGYDRAQVDAIKEQIRAAATPEGP